MRKSRVKGEVTTSMWSAKVDYQQFPNTTPEWRVSWVREQVVKALGPLPDLPSNKVFFDIGAGASPYKKLVQDQRASYISHDFNAYAPSTALPGVHTQGWFYASHDLICDILDIPESVQADVVLCSEVLEHVPDAVAAFKKIVASTKPGGAIIITTPFISLMHQAPYWFQSGLSPFWFQHWAAKMGVDTQETAVQGDYVDLVQQDFGRLMQFSLISRIIFFLLRKAGNFERARKKLTPDILSSGGCGTLIVLRKPLATSDDFSSGNPAF